MVVFWEVNKLCMFLSQVITAVNTVKDTSYSIMFGNKMLAIIHRNIIVHVSAIVQLSELQ